MWFDNHAGSVRKELQRRKFLQTRLNDFALEDEVPPSTQTKAAVERYFTARSAEEPSDAWDAVQHVVHSWRADNNAGGVPVYTHATLLPGNVWVRVW